jgi:hypothetical protein
MKVNTRPCREVFRNRISDLGHAKDNCMASEIGFIDKKSSRSLGVRLQNGITNEQLSGS